MRVNWVKEQPAGRGTQESYSLREGLGHQKWISQTAPPVPQAPWSWQHSMWYLGHTYTKNNTLILWHSDMARHPVFDLMATLSSKPVLWKGVGQGFHGCPLPHLIKGHLPARTFTCLLLRASTLINGPCRSQVELESYALPFLPTMSLIISFRSYVPKCLTQTWWTLLSFAMFRWPTASGPQFCPDLWLQPSTIWCLNLQFGSSDDLDTWKDF